MGGPRSPEATDEPGPRPLDDEVEVWDPLVRVFHWSVVASVASSWFTADDFRAVHRGVGYAVLVLIALRVAWGLAGGRRAGHARFGSFVRGPGAVWRYARDVLTGRAPRYLGHNPLGGWMVLALMATLVAIGTTGWMMSLDRWWGEEWVQELHEMLADGLLVLAGLHVSGVVVTGIAHRENLVASMLTGRKRAPEAGDVE